MYKVLLADDNALSRKAVRQSVSWKNNGCKIVGEAENGVKACQMIRELRPDIVLMDIRMPGMTGLEAIRCLKGEGIDSLYILITAYDDFAFAKEGIQLSVFDYILKPVAEKELQRVIQKAVDDLTQEIQDGEKEKRRRLLNEHAGIRRRWKSCSVHVSGSGDVFRTTVSFWFHQKREWMILYCRKYRKAVSCGCRSGFCGRETKKERYFFAVFRNCR